MSGRRSRRLRVIATRLNPKHPRLAHRRLKKLWARRGALRITAMELRPATGLVTGKHTAALALEPRP